MITARFEAERLAKCGDFWRKAKQCFEMRGLALNLARHSTNKGTRDQYTEVAEWMDTADRYAPTANRFLLRDAATILAESASTSTASSSDPQPAWAISTAAGGSATTQATPYVKPLRLKACHIEAFDLLQLRYNHMLNDRIMDAAFTTITTGNAEHGTCSTLQWNSVSSPMLVKLNKLTTQGVKKIALSLLDHDRKHWVGVFIEKTGNATEGSGYHRYVYNPFGPSHSSSAFTKKKLISSLVG